MPHPDAGVPNDPLLKTRPAAVYLAFSERGLQAAVARGDIAFVRVSPRRVAFRLSELNRFAEARTQRTGR